MGDLFPFFESNELDDVADQNISDDADGLSSSARDESLMPNMSSPSDQSLVENSIAIPEVRSSERVPKPKIFPDFVSYSVHGIVLDDPKTVEEAMSSANYEVWKRAMVDEFNSLQENNTWELTELPPNRKPIHCKWVFKSKRGADGTIHRYKARLVAKGFTQRKGIDYDETFSPVVRYSSIRLLIPIAAKYDLDINQMDVVTAFLHGEIDEEIYMFQPSGFIQSDKVCKLKKALYGLKKASRQWYLKLDSTLRKIGFQRSTVDPCVYFLIVGLKITFVAVYIDDLLIFSNDAERKLFLKRELQKRFKMTDLGEAGFCVGLKITRDREKGLIFLDQRRHIMDLLVKFEMADCNPEIPMDPNQKLSKDMSPKSSTEREEMSDVPYQELVGGLLYILQGTRPDITYAVNTVSKFNNDPGKAHWVAAKRILRYLKGTLDAKLTYSKDGNSDLLGFCDADWASNIDDRKSCIRAMYLWFKEELYHGLVRDNKQ